MQYFKEQLRKKFTVYTKDNDQEKTKMKLFDNI